MKVRNIIQFLFIISLILSSFSRAQIDRACLKEITLDKEYKGRVTLITLDTTSISSRIFNIDFDNDLLMIQREGQTEYTTSSYPIDSLAAIRFYKRGHIEEKWMIFGFLVGGVVLGIIFQVVDECKMSEPPEDIEDIFVKDYPFLDGFLIGGLAGLFLGFVLPPILNSRTIECGSALTSEEYLLYSPHVTGYRHR